MGRSRWCITRTEGYLTLVGGTQPIALGIQVSRRYPLASHGPGGAHRDRSVRQTPQITGEFPRTLTGTTMRTVLKCPSKQEFMQLEVVKFFTALVLNTDEALDL